MYYFGKYSVSIFTYPGGGIFFPRSEHACNIYYRDNGRKITGQTGFNSETSALIWAKKEIERHKTAIKSLENI